MPRNAARFAQAAIGRLPLPIDLRKILAARGDPSPEGVEELQTLPALLGAMDAGIIAELLGQTVPEF